MKNDSLSKYYLLFIIGLTFIPFIGCKETPQNSKNDDFYEGLETKPSSPLYHYQSEKPLEKRVNAAKYESQGTEVTEMDGWSQDNNNSRNTQNQVPEEIDAIFKEIDRAYDATLKSNNLPEDSPIVKKMRKKCEEYDKEACKWLANYYSTSTQRIEKEIQLMKKKSN